MNTTVRVIERKKLNREIYEYLLNRYPDVSEGIKKIEDILEDRGLYVESTIFAGEEGSANMELYREIDAPVYDWIVISNCQLIVMWQKMDSGRVAIWNAYLS